MVTNRGCGLEAAVAPLSVNGRFVRSFPVRALRSERRGFPNQPLVTSAAKA